MWDSYFNLSLVISTSFGYPQQFFAMLCAETLSEQIHHEILYQSSLEHGRIQGGGAHGRPPPISQDFKGDLAIYRPLSCILQYMAPPNLKSWLRLCP